jgi:hypothetical protein
MTLAGALCAGTNPAGLGSLPRFPHYFIHFEASEPFDIARQIDIRLNATLPIGGIKGSTSP